MIAKRTKMTAPRFYKPAVWDWLAYLAVIHLPLPDWLVYRLLSFAGRYAYSPEDEQKVAPWTLWPKRRADMVKVGR